MMHAEFGTIGIFDDLAGGMSANRAFELIPKALDIIFEQNRPDLFLTSINLLVTLVYTSDTTEIHPELAQNIHRIKEMNTGSLASRDTKLCIENLYRWHRIPT